MSEEAKAGNEVPAVTAETGAHNHEIPASDGEAMAVAAPAQLKTDPAVLDDDVPMTFPQKLFQVVSNEEHSDTIGWLPHGKGFIIYKKKKFAAEVLPRYFKQSKYTSFTRKLNRWGFTRVTRGPETGSYFHKFFQRGEPRLCLQMSCQVPKSGVAAGPYLSFPGGKGGGVFPTADLQNQALIRQQLQQLQLHQFHLQQMQMQQQQMQAAELFRQQQEQQQQQQQQVKKEDDDDGNDKDNKTEEEQSGEEQQQQDKEEMGEKAEEGGVSATPILPTAVPATNPYLQSLQQAGAAVPLGILPALQASALAAGNFAPGGATMVPMQPQPTAAAPPPTTTPAPPMGGTTDESSGAPAPPAGAEGDSAVTI